MEKCKNPQHERSSSSYKYSTNEGNAIMTLLCALGFILFVLGHINAKVIDEYDKTTKCKYYTERHDFELEYKNFTTEHAADVVESEDPEDDDEKVQYCNTSIPNYCFVVWVNDTFGRITVKKKGCFDVTCDGKKDCVSTEKKNNILFCCCTGDLCNSEFRFEPSPLMYESEEDIDGTTSESISFSLYIIIILLSTISVVGLLLMLRKKRQWLYKRNYNSEQRSQSDGYSTSVKLRPIELIEVKAKGRFGEVWRALDKTSNEYVAVKIVPAQDKQSWSTEQEVFKLPLMDHENILRFIAAEKHNDSLQPKYWIITAYHELGSLCDYLKSNTVSWEQLCSISYTMARGLSHLHDEIPSKLPECYKPPIAHRDFKSNNVLLKNDLTACIADFGLALVFKNNHYEDSNHGQVGTRRYMAPEVLEGSICFSTISFQRIDMYACGLVLWEILSRCTEDENAMTKYKMPFEDELGEHPTIEEMLQTVVDNRQRPTIKDSWRNHQLLSSVCEMIEECWEPEPEARLTASSVTDRFYWNIRSNTKCETKLLYNIV